MKLTQVIAISNGEKSKRTSRMSEVYHKLQKADQFEGFIKKYKPLDEESKDTLPEENKRVQYTVTQAIQEASKTTQDLINIVATLDKGNCSAKADLVVDNVTLVKDVPATHLIFLEKQLEDLKTFVSKLPTLDPSEEWNLGDGGLYQTKGRETNRTLKLPYVLSKAKATDKHPEQSEILYRDDIVGKFTTTRFSGSATKDSVNALLEKIDKLSKAVKMAREEANSIEVEKSEIGTTLMKFLFG